MTRKILDIGEEKIRRGRSLSNLEKNYWQRHGDIDIETIRDRPEWRRLTRRTEWQSTTARRKFCASYLRSTVLNTSHLFVVTIIILNDSLYSPINGEMYNSSEHKKLYSKWWRNREFKINLQYFMANLKNNLRKHNTKQKIMPVLVNAIQVFTSTSSRTISH